jgi:hypothetical protein
MKVRGKIKIFTGITILIISLLILKMFCGQSIASKNNIQSNVSVEDNEQYISEEKIINLIEEEGIKDSYYLSELSYELLNLDNDSELEIVAKTIGSVHLGDFFIFDKNKYGKYNLVTEQHWHIDTWDFSSPIANPAEFGNKKIFETVNQTGGTGIDVHEVNLWYIEKGEFIEAWKGIIKDREVFRDNYFLQMGSYQLNDDNNKLYAWLSGYTYQEDGVTIKKKLGTDNMVYRFDGTKFVLDEDTRFIK